MPHALVFPDIDPVLIHVWGPVAIRWYALSYIAGLLLGWWFIVRLIRDRGLWRNPPFNGTPPATPETIGDLVVWAALGIVIGGRLGWVILYGTILCSVSPDGAMCAGPPGQPGLPYDFLAHPLRIVSAWQGGMSFHGGLIGMIVALMLFARRRRIAFLPLGDLVALAAPIGLFFGRIANFINGELWGRVTDVPWAMIFCNARIQMQNGGVCPAGMVPRHPSQLYEAALEGIVLFALLQVALRVLRAQERPGLITALFFLFYALFRGLVEFFREPDAPFLGWVSMGQALSVLMFAVAALFFWLSLRREPARA
jgi:phosphatidylglycerol---prolipoprotein diacylglyceryl transferase